MTNRIKLTKVGQISTETLIFDKDTGYLLVKEYIFSNNGDYQKDVTTYRILNNPVTNTCYIIDEHQICSSGGFYSTSHKKIVDNAYIQYTETNYDKYVEKIDGIPPLPISILSYDLSEYQVEEYNETI